MPTMFAELSHSGGKQVVVDMSAPGGYWLEDHCTNDSTIYKISLGIWDYVILQEQSQVPTIEYYRLNSMYPSARCLDSMIVAHNQNTGFFMTWGRKHGGQQIIDGYSSPVFTDFFQMQDTLEAAYNQIGTELNAIVTPVGNGWGEAVMMDSSMDLWEDDNSHPTLKGSYLTACVFYATLFDANPIGLSYTAGLRREDAHLLQTAAHLAAPLKSDKP